MEKYHKIEEDFLNHTPFYFVYIIELKKGGYMAHVTANKVHFYFGIAFVVLIIVAGTIMRLSTIAEGILLILGLAILSPVAYFVIKKARKHDHGYTDRDFSRWNKKRDKLKNDYTITEDRYVDDDRYMTNK